MHKLSLILHLINYLRESSLLNEAPPRAVNQSSWGTLKQRDWSKAYIGNVLGSALIGQEIKQRAELCMQWCINECIVNTEVLETFSHYKTFKITKLKFSHPPRPLRHSHVKTHQHREGGKYVKLHLEVHSSNKSKLVYNLKNVISTVFIFLCKLIT